MTSTRNKNTYVNYVLEQEQRNKIGNMLLYEYSANGRNPHTGLAGNGLIQGQMPRNLLSYNSIEIDSFLKGINSCNLTEPNTLNRQLTPEIHCQPMTNIFDKKKTVIPNPLVVQKTNRPML